MEQLGIVSFLKFMGQFTCSFLINFFMANNGATNNLVQNQADWGQHSCAHSSLTIRKTSLFTPSNEVPMPFNSFRISASVVFGDDPLVVWF